MFGKVIKHELRTSAALYLVCFGIAFLFCIATIFNGKMALYERVTDNFVVATWMFFIIASSISVAVLVLMYSIDTAIRYDRSMYGREGYLTFTLPVSSTQLVLGKMTAAMIWGIGAFIMCGLLCFSMLYSSVDPEAGIMTTWKLIRTMFSQWEILSSILLFIGFCLICILEMVAMIYFSICIAYLPCFRKGNRIIALVLFFVLTYIEDKILDILFLFNQGYQYIIVSDDAVSAMQLYNAFQEVEIWGIVLGIMFTALYTSATIYITKKYTSLQ